MLIQPKSVIERVWQLTESSQKIRNRFALISKKDNDEFKLQTPWILCRDYFTDQIIASLLEGDTDPNSIMLLKSTVYGWNTKHYSNIKLNNIYIGIKTIQSKEGHKFLVTNQYEDILGFERSKVIYKEQSKDNQYDYLILSFDKKWLNNYIAFHGFTYLLRFDQGLDYFYKDLSIDNDFFRRVEKTYSHLKINSQNPSNSISLTTLLNKLTPFTQHNLWDKSYKEIWKFMKEYIKSDTCNNSTSISTYHNRSGLFNCREMV